MPLRACYGFRWMLKPRSRWAPLPAEARVAYPPRPPTTTREPTATVTPVGIFLPASDELFLYGVTSKVTSDCLVDRLAQWWTAVRDRFATITTLVINLDNGPENHSRRTQFMQRIVDFVQQYQVSVQLAYYPPYHSKYNAVERCWGILENH